MPVQGIIYSIAPLDPAQKAGFPKDPQKLETITPIEASRSKAAGNLRQLSKLEIIFCVFMTGNNLVNALIPFIGGKENC